MCVATPWHCNACLRAFDAFCEIAKRGLELVARIGIDLGKNFDCWRASIDEFLQRILRQPPCGCCVKKAGQLLTAMRDESPSLRRLLSAQSARTATTAGVTRGQPVSNFKKPSPQAPRSRRNRNPATPTSPPTPGPSPRPRGRFHPSHVRVAVPQV